MIAASPLSYLTPNSLNWVTGKGPGKGSSSAVPGDPNKTGFAIIRVKMADGIATGRTTNRI